MLDAAYALVVERVERQVLASVAAGEDVSLREVLDELDAQLLGGSEVSDLPLDQQMFRRSLGVA